MGRQLFIVLCAGLLIVGCSSANKRTAQKNKSGDFASTQQGDQSRQALAAACQEADLLCAAGQQAQDNGDINTAIEQYEYALQRDPNHQATLYRLGVLYAKQMKYPQAIATWEQYVDATNCSAAAYSNLGFCYELAGKSEEAEAAFQCGIEKDPKNRSCRINYGLMLARLGRADEAKKQLRRVLNEAETHLNLGMIYDQLDRPEFAREEYRKALECNPRLQQAKDRLANLE